MMPQIIIRRYESPEYDILDLDLNLWILDGYEGILQDVNVLIDNRDAVYLKTEDFELASDDDFLILYGINHTQTGFATYFNASFYCEELGNGVIIPYSTGNPRVLDNICDSGSFFTN